MNNAERAALTALLDNVGLGFTKCLSECKLLRAYLQRTQPRLTIHFCTDAEQAATAPAKKAKAKR
jgi:hypothetical protein